MEDRTTGIRSGMKFGAIALVLACALGAGLVGCACSSSATSSSSTKSSKPAASDVLASSTASSTASSAASETTDVGTGNVAQSGGDGLISSDYALQIALDATGLDWSTADVQRCELLTQSGQQVYSIQFNDAAGTTYHAFTIDAATGAVLDRWDDEIATTIDVPLTDVGTGNAAQSGGDGLISSNDALQVALDEAGLTLSNADLQRCDLLTQSGQQVYSIMFNDAAGTMYYSFLVDAATGAVLDRWDDAL